MQLLLLLTTTRFVPVAESVDEPQLLVTVTTGADGTAKGAATPDHSERHILQLFALPYKFQQLLR
jgi:hypothetical protein